MPKIYENTPSYYLYRKYIVFTFKRFYSKFVVLGKENIPRKGPAIFGPNHLNALMDALALLSLPFSSSVVYLARADVFGNKLARKGLRFVKILPAFRMRDGIENLGKNNDTFDMAQETLEKGHFLGIMPEGSQGDQRKLRPLVKGVFRIAFSTQEKLGEKEGVRLIPVGLDYSDRTKFGAELIVNYGKPILVNDYMDLYIENPALAINKLRKRYSEELHYLTLDLTTEQYYDCFETTVYAANTEEVKKMGLKNNTASRFLARQKLADKLVDMEKNNPEKINLLDKLCAEYRELQKKTKITTSTLEKPDGIGKLLLWTLGLIICLPVFISGLILNLLPFFLPYIMRKKMKIKYDGFFSSFDFFFGAVITFPLFYILQTIFYGIFTPLSWWTIPIFFVSQYLLGRGAYIWYKSAKKYGNNLRYLFMKRSEKEEIQSVRKEIISAVI